MSQPTSTSVLVKPTLLPRFVSNGIETLNVLSDAALHMAQGVDRITVGIDELATAMLEKQHKALMAELKPPVE